jgi:nucleotide-binding universal stress UspA family protein
VSKAQELFVGSVTNQVVQHANRTPIWIVGSRVSSLKVLCAVDGSEGSLKAVDHLAFMLGDNPECRITLFHAGASLAGYCPLDFGEELKKEIEGELMKSEDRCMDDFYSRAVKVLNEAGLSRDQIETKTKKGGLSVSKAILNEMRRGDYGTVVLGRRGENEASFLGHTSDKIMRGASEAAVWIVG